MWIRAGGTANARKNERGSGIETGIEIEIGIGMTGRSMATVSGTETGTTISGIIVG